MKLEIGYSHL